MSKTIKRVAGATLIIAGAAKIVSLSGDLLSLLFAFGIVVGVLAIVSAEID